MNLSAAITKVKAMRAELLTTQDYEALCNRPNIANLPCLLQECTRISSYLYVKSLKDFVNFMANELTAGTTNWAFVLWPRLNMLDKREAMRRVLGMEIDLCNILWIYRLKRYYLMMGDTVYSYLMPAGYKLNFKETALLVNSSSIPVFMEMLTQGPYGEIFEDTNDLTEQRISQAVKARFKTESHNSGIAMICGFLYEKHLEIRNIRAIIDGIKLGISPGEILKRLH